MRETESRRTFNSMKNPCIHSVALVSFTTAAAAALAYALAHFAGYANARRKRRTRLRSDLVDWDFGKSENARGFHCAPAPGKSASR